MEISLRMVRETEKARWITGARELARFLKKMPRALFGVAASPDQLKVGDARPGE